MSIPYRSEEACQQSAVSPRRAVKALVAAGACAIFAVGAEELVISPMAPPLAADLHATVPAVGLSVSVYGALTLVGSLVVAAAGARRSHRQFLLGAMTAFCLGTVSCALAPNLTLFLAGRGAAGFAAGVIVPTVYGLVADSVVFAERARAMGVVVSAWSLSLVLGVPAGGFASEHLGWRWTFAGLALFGLAAALVLAAASRIARTANPARVLSSSMPDGCRAEPSTADAADHADEDLAGAGATAWYVAATLLNMSAFYGLYTYLGAALKDTYPTATSVPEIMVLAYGLGFATCAFTGRVVHHRNYGRALPLVLLLISVTLLALQTAAGRPALLALALFTWGTGQGMAVTLLSTLLSQETVRRRDTALALYTVATNIGVILGAAIGGSIYDHHGLLGLVPSATGLTLLAALAAAKAHRLGQDRNTSSEN